MPPACASCTPVWLTVYLLVKCAKTTLLYNPQDSDLNEVYLESVASVNRKKLFQIC